MNKEVLVNNIRNSAKVTKDFIVKEYHRLADYLATKRMEGWNKEVLVAKMNHSAKVTKDFVVRKYNQFTDYLSEKRLERKRKGSNVKLGMSCVKYMLVLFNVIYLMISLSMIIIGTSAHFANNYYVRIWLEFEMLSVLWIATGIILTIVAIFGIIGAFRESIIWVNIHGAVMMIVFTLQIAAAAAAFSLIGSVVDIGSELITGMMQRYFDSYESAQKLDWIQTNLGCCGAEGPSDWNALEDYYSPDLKVTTFIVPLLSERNYKIPASCCRSDFHYSTCEKYYTNGCSSRISEIITESFMIIGTTVISMGVFQILGIVCAFMLARLIRKTRLYRHVPKCNPQSATLFDSPTYINYTPLVNSDEVKHI